MKSTKLLLVSTVSVALLAPITGYSGWQDWANKAKEVANDTGLLGSAESSQTSAVASTKPKEGKPSDAENTSGLRSAIAGFAEAAVKRLGKEDGFMKDAGVKVPLPDQLQSIKSMLAKMGQEDLIGDFELSMNRAAEQAVLDTAPVFAEAVEGLGIVDAANIIKGDKNAATEYFRGKTSDSLRQRMLPQVQQVIEKTGATRYYQQILGQAGGLTRLLSKDTLNLDEYVTNKSLDSLFKVMAEEEARLRDNPAGAATDLVKKVFSFFK